MENKKIIATVCKLAKSGELERALLDEEEARFIEHKYDIYMDGIIALRRSTKDDNALEEFYYEFLYPLVESMCKEIGEW